MIANKPISQAEGMPTKFGTGPFYLTLEKIRVDHAGTANSFRVPDVKDTHSFTFADSFYLASFFDVFLILKYYRYVAGTHLCCGANVIMVFPPVFLGVTTPGGDQDSR